MKGAAAGVVAATAWAAGEPALRRLARTPYSDVGLLGRLVARNRAWPLAGIAAAELENLALWPALAVADRIHPDRRKGSWPPLVRSCVSRCTS